MPRRVDHEGYLLNELGRRLDAQHGNDREAVQQRWSRIMADWRQNHPGDTDGPPLDATIMEVESGDCQWTIAEGAGADPVRTYRQLNEQFRDPNLIHPGDTVFVDRTTQLAVNRSGEDNVDLFRDQISARATRAHWSLPSSGETDAILQDIDSYLQSANHEQPIVDALIAPGNDGAGGAPVWWPESLSAGGVLASNGWARQHILASYLSSLGSDERRALEAQNLTHAEGADDWLREDVEASARGLDLSLHEDTTVGPRITAYLQSGESNNIPAFAAEFHEHAAVIDAGFALDADGGMQPAVVGPLTPEGWGGRYISLTDNELRRLESITHSYMASAPKAARDELITLLINDEAAAGESRQAAISAYLRTFQGDQREDARDWLMAGADRELREDIEHAVAGLDEDA